MSEAKHYTVEVPPAEESGLRAAFEEHMAQHFGVTNFVRRLNGEYDQREVQMNWTNMFCGYQAGLVAATLRMQRSTA